MNREDEGMMNIEEEQPKKKSRFSGKSIYERREERNRKKEEKYRKRHPSKVRSRSRSRSNSRSRHRSRSRHHHSRRSYSRSYSRSRSPVKREEEKKKEETNSALIPEPPAAEDPTQVIPEAEDPNNVHKQCERAALEATRRADILLKKRGLLPDTPAPEETEQKEENPQPEEEETYELPQEIQAKIEKDTKTGPLSWYKSTTASTVASLLEKKDNSCVC